MKSPDLTLFRLGARRSVTGTAWGTFEISADSLVTHAVIVGMTGSGKTGLVTVMIEEALRNRIGLLIFDIKGDLSNLKLAFPTFDPEPMTPWVDPAPGDADGIADPPLVEEAAAKRRKELAAWNIDESHLRAFAASTHIRVITPGSEAGEPLHLLSALERRSKRWDDDVEAARASLGSAVSMVLRLIGRDADPGRSREHVFLCALAEPLLMGGSGAELEKLIPQILEPPIESLGALPIETFFPAKQRADLAADLNTLIASQAFAAWRKGLDLDVGQWMAPVDGKTTATIINVSHLDDEARTLVLGQILEGALGWVRTLPGTSRLRNLIVFDELYGYLPPHPKDPPTKKPLVALMKQARAYGVGCILATQNPMDLDYRALSNAGTWIIGRLQTDADRKRVMEGLGEATKGSPIGELVKKLSPRWFVFRDPKTNELTLLNPRWAMSLLRGPMTPKEIQRTRDG